MRPCCFRLGWLLTIPIVSVAENLSVMMKSWKKVWVLSKSPFVWNYNCIDYTNCMPSRRDGSLNGLWHILYLNPRYLKWHLKQWVLCSSWYNKVKWIKNKQSMHLQISGDREIVQLFKNPDCWTGWKKLHVVCGTFKCLCFHKDCTIQEWNCNR